ncbi:major facilitator superfamily protein [Advenella kashmirensis WT001]|uniref:Major facilitator superfamily protein n=1 Tax=Advenella kashmirensis (strain DSM 17095 / LMG 22695 / WT001) TaxID=1036672 RepID=I3UH25_ADVKW|nr:MFS transporter [Advenella kashmirensis]AFK64313.1 major facilitator superfamily protein [Advenella kashmirensis WT001]
MRISLEKWPGPITTISLAQLFGTSLWFSANAASEDLMDLWHVSVAQIGWLTSAVQGGFIVGTLLLSLTGLADKFRASNIFAVSAILGAVLNLLFALLANGIWLGVLLRFLVGLTLAGIYPLGMKMIIKWAPEKAGWGLSILVAMLTLGTALPHGLKALAASYPWYMIVSASSCLSVCGALLILALGEGPHGQIKRHTPQKKGSAILGLKSAFARPSFRQAAFGYFGHMWELYAFWAIVPLLISSAITSNSSSISTISFYTISAGAIGCVIGGVFSHRLSNRSVAVSALSLSCVCCIIFAVIGHWMSPTITLILFLIWGAAVVADSPQFSAMSAQACPPEYVGSALALQNAIGFAITMISILIMTRIIESFGQISTLILAIGPVLGLIALAMPADQASSEISNIEGGDIP